MAALSKAEAAVYDRQIRVWGVDTQQRLNAAKILIAGTGGLVAEVAKNVVLAGAGLVALMDDTPIGSAPGTSFLLPADAPANQTVAQVSVAALQEMNPLVKVALVSGSAATADASLVADYDVVLLVSPSLTLLRRYDEACRQHSVAFFGAASRGACSFFFADLQSHTYASTEQQDGKPKGGQHTSQFCSLAEALQAPWSSLRPKRTHELYYGLRVIEQYEAAHQQQLPQPGDAAALEQLARDTAAAAGTDADRTARAAAGYAFGDRELPPVNAVLGGLLANELLKAISHKGEPVNNWLFYSLSSGVAGSAEMGKVPVRLKEVVYTVSPFEVTILNGLFKDFPKKVQKNLREKGWDISLWCVAPVAATVWYAESYKEKEKLEHRY